MSGRKAIDRDAETLEDIRILRGRGKSMSEIAKALGMSRSSLYRVLAERNVR